jgi:hypothetical protein
MKVKATRTGHYNLVRIKVDQVFEITKPEHYSAVWMEPVGNVPTEFKEEVDRKTEALTKRPTMSEVRQRADAAAIAVTRLAVAQGVRDGIADVEAQREKHLALQREAASQPSSDGLGADPGKGSGADSGKSSGKK